MTTEQYPIFEALQGTTQSRAERPNSDVNTTAGAPGFENAPSHYQAAGGLQSFDVIDAYGLDFYTGNAWKYLSRWDKKGNGKTDLEKAAHYLQEALTRAPRVAVKHLNLDHIDLGLGVILSAFGFTGLIEDAARDLLLSQTSDHPRVYLRSAKAQVEEFLKTL